MALKYPDILKSNNPAAYGVADGREVTGHRTVAQLAATTAADIANNKYGLYGIPDKILSPSGANTDNDALGQVWYCVATSKYYRLTAWANRKAAAGWTEVAYPTPSQLTKLDNIETGGTADSALTEAEIDSVLV